ncbi:hypothetical protein TYRP_005394 [Tyrophagus putrescentiae]|nr:hypothetical protein TYRP_005394 [Tyrophagus putrescentiae]
MAAMATTRKTNWWYQYQDPAQFALLYTALGNRLLLPLTYQQWGRLYQKFFHALVLLFAAQFAPLHLEFRVKLTHRENSARNFGEPSLPATDLSTVGTALPKVFSCSSSIIRGAVCALVLSSAGGSSSSSSSSCRLEVQLKSAEVSGRQQLSKLRLRPSGRLRLKAVGEDAVEGDRRQAVEEAHRLGGQRPSQPRDVQLQANWRRGVTVSVVLFITIIIIITLIIISISIIIIIHQDHHR